MASAIALSSKTSLLEAQFAHFLPKGRARAAKQGGGPGDFTVGLAYRFLDVQADTTSILTLIETRWHLTPLGDRDANAAGLTNALELN
jgi:hypothetical protein